MTLRDEIMNNVLDGVIGCILGEDNNEEVDYNDPLSNEIVEIAQELGIEEDFNNKFGEENGQIEDEWSNPISTYVGWG